MNATLVPTPGVAGRSQVIREGYEAYAEQIYKFAFFKLGNREDAEDVTSQVFMKAAVALDASQDARSKLAWLYQVARTSISDYWRRYYKTLASSLEEMEEDTLLSLPAEPVCLGVAPEDDLDSQVERVRSLLALLPENYRRVLELRFLYGYSASDTALALGVTEGNVRVLQHRGLQKAAALMRAPAGTPLLRS
jgi:RNA polymerase sigma-70 factor, ECF subfamily